MKPELLHSMTKQNAAYIEDQYQIYGKRKLWNGGPSVQARPITYCPFVQIGGQFYCLNQLVRLCLELIFSHFIIMFFTPK